MWQTSTPAPHVAHSVVAVSMATALSCQAQVPGANSGGEEEQEAVRHEQVQCSHLIVSSWLQ